MTVRAQLISFFVHRWRLMQEHRQNGRPDMALELAHFHGPDLESIDQTHPLSGLRIARVMRSEGLVDFACVGRRESKYKITQVDLARIAEKGRRPKHGESFPAHNCGSETSAGITQT